MAEQPIAHETEESEESNLDHEARIVERILDSIAPGELPCDVDSEAVAHLLWLNLTTILFVCGFTADDLIADIRTEQLIGTEPEGSA